MFDSSHVPPVGGSKGLLILYSMFTTWGKLLCKKKAAAHMRLFFSTQKAESITGLYSLYSILQNFTKLFFVPTDDWLCSHMEKQTQRKPTKGWISLNSWSSYKTNRSSSKIKLLLVLQLFKPEQYMYVLGRNSKDDTTNPTQLNSINQNSENMNQRYYTIL